MITSTQFRKQLKQIMPGYKWTVHRSTVSNIYKQTYLAATGIQSKGLNRMSTLQVTVREKNNQIEYNSRSAGFGRSAPWLASWEGATLAQSLRGLQELYEVRGNRYLQHSADLEGARAKNV
jgi:hypothetical protein